MERCDLKSMHECCCPENACPHHQIEEAPVLYFTLREQFFVTMLLIIFCSIIAYAALSRANEVFRQQMLAEQESIYHG